MFLVDSHCHLDGLDYESLHKDVDDVLAKAAARDVKFCLAVATTLPGYLHMRDLVGERANVVFFAFSRLAKAFSADFVPILSKRVSVVKSNLNKSAGV